MPFAIELIQFRIAPELPVACRQAPRVPRSRSGYSALVTGGINLNTAPTVPANSPGEHGNFGLNSGSLNEHDLFGLGCFLGIMFEDDKLQSTSDNKQSTVNRHQQHPHQHQHLRPLNRFY